MTAPLSAKDISDWLKVAFMVGTVLLACGRFAYQVQQIGDTVKTLARQTGRIERYLSSKDPQYWEKAKVYEEDP